MYNFKKNKIENKSNIILDLFKRNFFIEYNNSSIETKKLMKKYFQHIYRRWYYSSLIFNNYLSPSNIINKIFLQNNLTSSTMLTVAKPILNHNKICDITFDFYEYNIENHPIIKDICLLTSFFTPDREINYNGLLQRKFIESIKYKFTIPDVFYINYITKLSFQLKIIKKLPSINCNRAQICYNSDFWESDSIMQFKKIVSSSIDISARKLSESFTEVHTYFNFNYLKSLIKNGVHMENDIENDFLKKLNLDLKYIMSLIVKKPNELSINESKILQLFNKLGCFIESYFITIMGQYLGLINPINTFTFIFPIEIQKYAKNYNINTYKELLLFNPSSLYDLSNFGETYIDSKIKGAKIENIPENIDYKKLTYSLNKLNKFNDIKLNDILNFR
ncbi:hypothetical protein CPAST_c35960 [Clostridium pasteurianum DSM 525 = ATCC 6013]|uniref:Uncharacterized protein n=1 Tax=Clostridium pasteurianum DSM 525 = ATCC 6013 TaxID=1262449 RepID=A0A0H3J8V0_CLOPA|nr:hypothetical protein [Clostridium pasteurianum]AJA49652.1 hypothetical protein CPAST_c35960 [Clostridium pasteurianum DSM 525 = ATCC 6013]AJA53640.1 hypothetical protein CLPA_c35960 [Clostridium pasteurianum DSM 525 = ATCC 6013]AOZ76804.1 hypothetical protein AQ983_17475 [Clostridium pasteurianum DSM 525 = ATCC 6013]AOZ80601.1 hypothetical protein AQ984_17470 [Clostridium pasteurianum]ELP58832.1 hypothetical protein F502_11926 [Clostridium pasteurianum DSM 525 = ATCC 6013]